jgi:site-specific recombinase XerD
MIIKKILGHSSLEATEMYTHISSKKMKEFMENCTISSILEKRERLENGK